MSKSPFKSGLVVGKKRRRLEALAQLATIKLPTAEAQCMRCKAVAREETSARGIIIGTLMMPGYASARELLLCGKCALVLLELIGPDKVGSPQWAEYKAKKLLEWG